MEWWLLDKLNILSWSPLRFSTMDKPILRTLRILTFLTNFRPWPFFDQIPTIYLNKDLILFISYDFDKSKKMQSVRTIAFHPFSRRDLCYVSENKGFRLGRKTLFSLRPGKCVSPFPQGFFPPQKTRPWVFRWLKNSFLCVFFSPFSPKTLFLLQEGKEFTLFKVSLTVRLLLKFNVIRQLFCFCVYRNRVGGF